MQTLILSLLLITGLQLSSSSFPLPLTTQYPAETVVTNTTTTGFTVTLYRIEDNQTYTYSVPAGYDNVGTPWQLVAGTYNITFTPTSSSYGATRFLANTGSVYRYNSVNTSAATISSVSIYAGGGNQIAIEPI